MITSSSSLSTIRQAVEDDFGVVISNDDAKEIRAAKKRGTVLWNAEHLVIMALDAGIERIYQGHIKLRSGAVYSAAEWRDAK